MNDEEEKEDEETNNLGFGPKVDEDEEEDEEYEELNNLFSSRKKLNALVSK